MIQITFINNEHKVASAPDNSNLLRVSLREKGGTVHIATAEESAALAAVMRPAFDAAFAGDDPDSKKMVELIQKLEN